MEQSQAFRNVVTSEAELAELLGGTPSKIAANKVIGQLDEHCREFISKSPFLLMATADGNGGCDVSPRGDAPGFVQVLDEHRLLIPRSPPRRKRRIPAPRFRRAAIQSRGRRNNEPAFRA
jgi:predicted pyridoxine 5'-phosphate oxidase superfamily flavin-nucleotide-binding protein